MWFNRIKENKILNFLVSIKLCLCCKPPPPVNKIKSYQGLRMLKNVFALTFDPCCHSNHDLIKLHPGEQGRVNKKENIQTCKK